MELDLITRSALGRLGHQKTKTTSSTKDYLVVDADTMKNTKITIVMVIEHVQN
jgi:hypothetical protein